MKTYNIYYKNKQQFKDQVLTHNFDRYYNNILIQLFTSKINIEDITILRDDIISILPNAKLIGTTSDGAISSSKIVLDDDVVSITIFEKTNIKLLEIKRENQSSFELGQDLVDSIKDNDPKALIIFADATRLNGEEFINGIDNIIPNTHLAGGMAALVDGVHSYIFTNDNIYSSGAVAIALYNENLEIYSEYKFNWQKIGQKMTITKSIKNRVYTIDNKPAHDIYAYYLGEEIAKELPHTGIEFPLILERGDMTIARAVIGINHEEGYLEFAGNIHEGESVTFGYGNSESILLESNQISKLMYDVNIESIFIYSCMARRRLMPKLIYKEIEPLSKLAPTTGFFTYGEFYKSHTVELLNETMTILAMSESDNQNKKDKIKEITSSVIEFDKDYLNTMKALSHLVNVTSDKLTSTNINLINKNNELNKIKNSLKKEVDKQLEILREKDTMLIQQSRLAAMGEMIGNIAHQWRQPLNVLGIKNMTLYSYYNKGEITDEFIENYVNSVTGTIQHMSDTIDDFKNFFKPDKVKEKFNLYSTIKKSLEVIEDSFVSHNIKCIIEDGHDIILYGYKNEFSQVILNLLNNAKDALILNHIEHGIITIKIFKKNKETIIEIHDNGKGVPINIIDKVFEPYFTTKHQVQGSGIGLYMSKMIIEKNMGGILSVRNGMNGAIFSIKFSDFLGNG